MTSFNPSILSTEDFDLARDVVGSYARLCKPDLTIAPDGRAYLYRWHLVPLNERTRGNVFFHVQVLSDPERPLHDHPWDNQSVILSGGYDEMFSNQPSLHGFAEYRQLRQGDVVTRKATEAHRLILPPDIPYTMTQFSTGPKVRSWGFWYPDGWHHNGQHVINRADGVSVGRREEEAK